MTCDALGIITIISIVVISLFYGLKLFDRITQ